MNARRAPSLVALLALVAAMLALACGDQQASATPALTELGRVAGVKPGQPILVFVYTDG